LVRSASAMDRTSYDWRSHRVLHVIKRYFEVLVWTAIRRYVDKRLSGYIRRRGPVKSYSGISAVSRIAHGGLIRNASASAKRREPARCVRPDSNRITDTGLPTIHFRRIASRCRVPIAATCFSDSEGKNRRIGRERERERDHPGSIASLSIHRRISIESCIPLRDRNERMYFEDATRKGDISCDETRVIERACCADIVGRARRIAS